MKTKCPTQTICLPPTFYLDAINYRFTSYFKWGFPLHFLCAKIFKTKYLASSSIHKHAVPVLRQCCHQSLSKSIIMEGRSARWIPSVQPIQFTFPAHCIHMVLTIDWKWGMPIVINLCKDHPSSWRIQWYAKPNICQDLFDGKCTAKSSKRMLLLISL